MKNLFVLNQKIVLITLITFSVFSCKSVTKRTDNLTNINGHEKNDLLNLELVDIKGKLYFLQPTIDPKFCDLSKIIETDCGLGYYYFNNKGKVTFTFQCVDDTSIVYFLGSYKKSKNGINCHFDYSYECFFDTVGNQFKGKGKLVKEKDLFEIKILVTDCTDTYGYVNEYEDSKNYYLIQKANKIRSEIFWNFFRQSKVKKDYL
jgi:hypothetical protein